MSLGDTFLILFFLFGILFLIGLCYRRRQRRLLPRIQGPYYVTLPEPTYHVTPSAPPFLETIPEDGESDPRV